MTARYRRASAVVVASCLGACAQSEPELIETTDSAQADTGVVAFQTIAPAGTEFEAVTVQTSMLIPQGNSLRSVRLELGRFGDVTADLPVFERAADGAESWRGSFSGDRSGRIVLVRSGGVVTGTVISNDGIALLLRQVSGETHVVERVDLTTLGPELPPLPARDETSTESSDEQCAPGQDIQVLVVVLSGEVGNLGGVAKIERDVVNAFGNANENMDLSGATHHYRFRALRQFQGPTTRDFTTLLDAMRDDRIRGVAAARDSLDADVVVLWMPHGNYCGIAYLLDKRQGGRPGDAFAVVSRLCALASWTLAHELGHVLGVSHDRTTSAGEDPRPTPARDYGYGYRDPRGLFRDLMAYQCPAGECYRLPFYSTPGEVHDGRPLGVDHATNASGSADAARTVRETGCLVARYRPRAR